MSIFDDSEFVWGQAGLPGTGLTAAEKTTITSEQAALKAAAYIVQTPSTTLTAEQALSALSTGLVKVTTGTGVLSTAVAADLPPHTHTVVSSLNFVINDGGGVITPGVKGYCDLIVPFACTVTKWIVYNDQAGSIVIDVWRDTYANYPPTVADAITGTLKPQTTNLIKGLSTSVSSWSALNAEDVLRINVDSAATVTRSTLTLLVTRNV